MIKRKFKRKSAFPYQVKRIFIGISKASYEDAELFMFQRMKEESEYEIKKRNKGKNTA